MGHLRTSSAYQLLSSTYQRLRSPAYQLNRVSAVLGIISALWRISSIVRISQRFCVLSQLSCVSAFCIDFSTYQVLRVLCAYRLFCVSAPLRISSSAYRLRISASTLYCICTNSSTYQLLCISAPLHISSSVNRLSISASALYCICTMYMYISAPLRISSSSYQFFYVSAPLCISSSAYQLLCVSTLSHTVYISPPPLCIVCILCVPALLHISFSAYSLYTNISALLRISYSTYPYTRYVSQWQHPYANVFDVIYRKILLGFYHVIVYV